MASLVRFGQVLDPMKKTYFQNLLSQFIQNNCKFPYEELNFFFPRQAMTKIRFVLHSRYKWVTPCRVWFDLDKSLTP